LTRFYLDSAPIIYIVETVQPWAAALDIRMAALNSERVTSYLARLECRVRPLRDHNRDVLMDFDGFFDQAVELTAISPQIIDEATSIRARFNFSVADAIHLATAVSAGCDVFLTNDRWLNRFSQIPIEVIS